jgi:hypothetical protein
MKYLKPTLALLLVAYALFRIFSGGPINHPPGVLAPDEPFQELIANGKNIKHGEFQLQPRARYEIQARVLAVERYRTDAGSDLAPIDFAMGWGVMSDTATLQHFRIKQGGRFYSIYPDEKAIAIPAALRASANMHLIPSTATVRELLFSARPGNVLKLSGYLVTASRSDGFTWNTSLTRDDDGNGACELMYVESAQQK